MKFFLLITYLALCFSAAAQEETADQRISHYTLQINIHPDSAGNYMNRGKAYNDKGDFASAVSDCNMALKLDPQNADALKIRGFAYFNQKKYDSSITDLDKAISKTPNIPKLWYVRGLDYYWLNKLDNAINDFTEALKLDPKYMEAWYFRGNTYYWAHKYDLAVGDLSESLSFDPKNADALYYRGISYSGLGKFDLAVEDFTRRLSVTPGDAEMLAWRGVNYYKGKKYEAALKDLTEALRIDPKNLLAWVYRGHTYGGSGKPELAVTDYTQALLLDPENTEALYERGFVYYFSLKKFQDAINDLTKVLKLLPKYSDAFVYRGNAYTELGKYDLALEDYKQALQLNPKNVLALVYQGEYYKKLGATGMAIMDFNAALQIWPNSMLALLDRGNIYSDLLKYDSAIHDFSDFLNIDPSSVTVRTNRGNAFFYKGDYELAISDYSLILSKDPNDLSALLNRANAYGFLGQADLEKNDIRQALLVDPTSIRALNLLGRVYTYANQLDSALLTFNRALNNNPKDTISLSSRGWFYSFQKKYDLAIADFDEVLKINPKFAEAFNNRGLVFYRQNKYDLAIADFKKALELQPANARAMLNLILVYLSHDDFTHAAQWYNEYRQKKLTSYMDIPLWSFLKDYVTACCDYLVNKNYEKALPLIEASLKEYKEVNTGGTDNPVSTEYANVLAKAAFISEQLSQKDKALEYYRIAYMINPQLPGISSKMGVLATYIKKEVAANNAPAEIELLSPKVVQGTLLEKAAGNAPLIFVSGTIKDPAGTEWVNVNGTAATTLRPDGYFAVKISNDVNDITIQAKNKTGRISSFTYQLQNTQPSKSDDASIPPIPAAEKPRFHAVLIACSNYNDGKLKNLPNTIIEAKEYKKILTTEYGFAENDIVELYDKNYMEILAALYSKLKSLTPNDNLVLFFAGHGTYKQTTNDLIGYWIPLNATVPEIDYISNQKLDEIVAGCAAKHILLVSDACYSAAMRSDDNTGKDDIYLPKYKQYQYKSRQILTSGGLEKVPEKSVFIDMVMKTLDQADTKFLSAKELYNYIFPGVKNQTSNQPELNLFGKDGNEGGQFYFIRSK